MAIDVGEADFSSRVLERSSELPVVVDFWAEWCAPCRQLTPVLEAAVGRLGGAVELVKVDTDRNPELSARYGIRGIPAVMAFRDGEVAAEFTGAQPPARVEQFLDGLAPSEADRLVDAGDEDSLRQALQLDPRHAEAARALGHLLLARGDANDAIELLTPLEGDFVADGLRARARLLAGGELPEDLRRAFDAWDDGNHAAALEGLQEAFAANGSDAERRDLLRQAMVAIFTELGAGHPLAREHRRRLSAALT